MEDRRCRKGLAVMLTTAIILSATAQTVYAIPEKSKELLYSRVLEIQQTVLENVMSDARNIILTKANENRIFRILLDKFSGQPESQISFVIEQLPLEKKAVITADKGSDTVIEAAKMAEPADSADLTNSVDSVREPERVSSDISRSSRTVYDQEDVMLLAKIIYAEARGESFEGQVAVGAVVLNRVESPKFPDTIREVIYQPGQFSAVLDRQIELTPGDEAYQAALAALEGQDPSKGALFYYNPQTATDNWIKTRSVVKNIGNHNFCV
ncbi:cell wall hydrolase [Dehalobacter sp. 14DCB1]|uniref:cell wall hydrolase n=1 Tax=Dehalobacter sp. 14DCB1 TaxID=2070227 RepID=UPI000475933A|nr:cell wall hydrolase [Dehalobacter sp. 14DCB1]TCX53870.1 spore cortex-lytic protein [Dehalobacter sp. 14DCB1]